MRSRRAKERTWLGVLTGVVSQGAELVQSLDRSVLRYLEQDPIRNSLVMWYLERSDPRFKLYVAHANGLVKAHLSLYDTPEAIYSDLGGEESAAEKLLSLVPKKGVVTTTNALRDLVQRKLECSSVYPNDFMAVARGEETLRTPERASRLSSREHADEYSRFGSSFNVPDVPMDWIRECLDRDVIFGVFSEGQLASVASLVSWLPKTAVIMGVETRPEFRRRGLAAIVVSAAVREGLARSESCSLFVRSDNEKAIALYKTLGFKKVGEEYWIDIGTGMIP